MFVFGSVGNTLALWFMFAKRRKASSIQQKGLKILLSLIVADSIVCYVCLPLQAMRMLHHQWVLHCNFEAVAFYLTILTVWASSLTICGVAFDRLILLTKYQSYPDIVTDKRINIFTAICWSLSCLGPATKFFPGGGGNKLFAPLNAVNLILPIIVLPFVYCRIVGAFKKSKQNIANRQNMQQQQQQQQHTRRDGNSSVVTRRCLILIGNFFFCSITATLFMVLLIANEKLQFMSSYTEDLMTRFSFLGLTMNSCINPIIYVLQHKEFKKFLLSRLCPLTRKNRKSNSLQSEATVKASTAF